MRYLVLGGTAWLGGHVASTALRAGHQVTCLARGTSGDVPDGAVLVRADRAHPGAYDQVAGTSWDAVVDVARQPGQVRDAATALAGRAGFFVFVSSASAYADQSVPGRDETAALLPPLPGDVMESMEAYGRAKVACEAHVLRAFGPDRVLLARAGLIGGPGDDSDRAGYWPWRFARPAAPDGSVLVPDAPDLLTQLVDVRDLAAWLVDAGARRVAGTFDAVGRTVPLAHHLQAAREVAGHAGPVVRADPRWLLDHGVQEWAGPRSLPLWLADPDWFGLPARDGGKAHRAGLAPRPLRDTLADTLTWELSRPPRPARKAGLSDQDERELLDALRRA